MNILLVGSGGREHALAWKIKQSPLLTRLVCAPGNPGMAAIAEVRAVGRPRSRGLVALAREIAADLVVIGPEVAIEAGLADALAEAGIPCFGPTAAAGRLESSKAFTKAFCDRHHLPTAALPHLRRRAGRQGGAGPLRAALCGQGRRPGGRQGRGDRPGPRGGGGGHRRRLRRPLRRGRARGW